VLLNTAWSELLSLFFPLPPLRLPTPAPVLGNSPVGNLKTPDTPLSWPKPPEWRSGGEFRQDAESWGSILQLFTDESVRPVFILGGKSFPGRKIHFYRERPDFYIRKSILSSAFKNLPTFTFPQVGIKAIEFQAMPGPETRAWCAKIMRPRSFLGPGGQIVLFLRTGVFRCRGARPGTRAARPILRKRSRISGQNFFPADAFSAPCPCFRATSLLWREQRTPKSEGGQAFKNWGEIWRGLEQNA